MYIELHTASAFSFLDAASLPETLVEQAARLGYPALALLDRDGVYGAPRFHRAARAAGLRPIVGAELTIGTNGAEGDGPRSLRWPLAVLVESQEGYRHLCRLVTRMKLGAPKGEGALALDDFDGCTGGLVALAGRELLGARHGVGGLLDHLVGVFGRSNLYVEVQRHWLRDEDLDNQRLIDLAAAFHVPVVATNGVRFAGPGDRALYDVLTCIRHKTNLARAGRKLARNAERHLKAPAEMAELFRDLPAAVAATEALADRLQYTLADLGYRFPEFPVPPGETAVSFLRKITDLGARERYRPYHERARAQIARELDLIERLNLAGYFLIVWDIVNFCRQHDILAQGRGSAANSAVCYSLGITAVDPVGMELLFERFLSEERGEWPDIDLDLPSGDRRERVIQHVYEKYGRHGAAMTANVITYRGRSAAREVGKVLGIEPARIDRLARVMSGFGFVEPGDGLTGRLRDAGCDPGQPEVRLFADLWQRMQDLPRHLGQHSGGMVICQGRLDEVVPLEQATMPGRVVIQWDKDDCAEMGIVKVDLLGLGMMAVLQDALGIINGRGEEPVVDLAHLPPDDPDVYRMLQAAETIGVFQVESRAQMATLPRLRPERFYDLVVEVAIIRPGPDRRPDGASVPEPPRRPRAGHLSASLARADPEAHAGRAAVPGAVAADGDGGGRLHRRAGRGAAARARVQAIEGADGAGGGQAARGDGPPGDRGGGRRRDRHAPSSRLRCTAFPSRTRPASRCSRMRARISRRISPPRSTPPCSTTSRWGSTTRPRSSRTRSGAASGSPASTRSTPTGRARWRWTAPSGWACATSRGCARRWGGRSRRPGSGPMPRAGPCRRGSVPVRLRRSVDARTGQARHRLLQRLRARGPGGGLRGRSGRAAGRPRAAFPLDRRPGGAHRRAPGGTGDAGGDRRAQRVRVQPPRGALAGGARGPAGRRAVPGRRHGGVRRRGAGRAAGGSNRVRCLP